MFDQQLLKGIACEWLYENDFANSARYVLGVRGANPLFCVGINPSTAVPGELDNTLKSVARLARANGFEGWVMFNVYPQRATDPSDLHGEMDPVLHQRNVKSIGELLCSCKNAVMWAAWGTLIGKRSYLRNCLADIYGEAKRNGCVWITVGKESAGGHPHHPLYLGRGEKARSFDMEGYVRKLLAGE